jgi:hypothetical protein
VWIVVPVLMGSALWVVEANNTTLTARLANQAKGYVIESTPTFFGADAIAFSSTVLRMAYAANEGESTDALIETDLTVASGANSRGVVSGGTVVFTPGTTFTLTTQQVGPPEGSDLAGDTPPPINEPVTDPRTGDRMTLPWQGWVQSVTRGLGGVADAVTHIPVPGAPPAGFGVVAPSGQTPVAAFTSTDTLALTSLDGSVAFTTNPATRTVDLSASGSSGRAWVPVTDGDPVDPQIIFDAAGQVVVTEVPV